MNLRLRLIVAFFLLSVVPLGAVTLYTYTSNAKALRDAAQHEAELLAGELTQRMELVTAQLSERVGHLMDISNAAETSAPAPRSARASAARPTPSSTNTDNVAETLGDVAMLLNNVQIRGMRGFGDGRGRGTGPGPGGPGANNGPNGGRGANQNAPGGGFRPPPSPDASTGGRPGGFTPRDNGPSSGTPSGQPQAEGSRPLGARGPSDQGDQSAPRGGGLSSPPGGGSPGQSASAVRPPLSGAVPGAPPPSPNITDDGKSIEIDMMPIRRELFRQLAPDGQQMDQLSSDERQRIIAEVNQRMLGIAQGIQMGTAEAQKKVSQAAQQAADAKTKMDRAQQAADAKAREAAKAAEAQAAADAQAAGPVPNADASSTGAVPATMMQRRTALSGSRLDVTMERDGKVVHQADAEVNLPNLLMTVFTATRRERGEVPFAVSKDGHVYTPNDADRKTVEALNTTAVQPGTPPGTTMVRDWIIVTTADPTGSGLKFGIARPVGDSLSALRRTTVRNAGFGLMFILVAIVGIVPVATRLTRNLSRLSDGVLRIAHGDYGARVEVGSHDEVGHLAVAFNQMAEDVERHQRAAVQQERVRRELELGRQIQHDMLPQAPLQLGLTEVKGVSVPAREVGGDFFNYFVLPNGSIALLVGDVSGKGVGAALLMANLQASIRTRLTLGQDLASVAHQIDCDIEASTPGPLYATLFVGIFASETRELRYVNAGHYPQYVLRKNGGFDRMESTGLPVGLLAGRDYSEKRVQLAAGDLVFFYTDGCVDNENANDEMFGVERLEALLQLCAAQGVDDVLARVERAIAEFRGSREPFDDATMMVVRVG